MNQRLRELAMLAFIKAGTSQEQIDRGEDSSEYVYTFTQETMREFARLIVQDCNELNKEELAFNAYARMLDKYNQHFEV